MNGVGEPTVPPRTLLCAVEADTAARRTLLGRGRARAGRLRGRVSAVASPDVARAIALDHAVIAVSDWEVATRFYRDVIGAEVVPIDSRRVSFRLGQTQLNVHGPGFMPSENVARVPVQPGNSDICFVWDGPIEEAVAHLDRHGIAVETGPVERPGAQGTGTSVYFRDPDGSLLEFISYA